MTKIRIGCAGWGVPREHATLFSPDGSHLERYSSCFNCVEINSSFYRAHRPSTYTRWASSVPQDFQFSVKAPKTITHEQKLTGIETLLTSFLGEIAGLGEKCGPLLFQLPPSLEFNQSVADRFFRLLRSDYSNAVVCEPRHRSWFSSSANDLLQSFNIGRVAADPPYLQTLDPGGSEKTIYYRLHGSPRMYYSSYTPAMLNSLVDRLLSHTESAAVWCIFDNMAAAAATDNAQFVTQHLRSHSIRCTGLG